MQRVIDFCRRQRTLLAGLAVVLMAVLVAAWTAYDVGTKTDGTTEFTIVNDVYSQTLVIPSGGLAQKVQLAAGQCLYGVRVKYTNYGHAFIDGVVNAELWDGDTSLTIGMQLLASVWDHRMSSRRSTPCRLTPPPRCNTSPTGPIISPIRCRAPLAG